MSTDMLTCQLRYTHRALGAALRDVTQEESLQAPPGGGNCLNWVVGHILSSRNGILTAVGKEPIWGPDKVAVYKRGSEPLTDPGKALELSSMREDLDRSQETIVDGLAGMTAEKLAAPAPFSPANNPDETVGSLLAVMIFHEAYHTGQAGLLRRMTGREGIVR